MTGCTIRGEEERDRSGIRALNVAAFPSDTEARLVEELRERACPLVSLVADRDGEIIGHILFSPVSLATGPAHRLMGLGPMAVAAAERRGGVGSSLVTRGLEACRRLGADAVVVLGDPAYYQRFGFVPAARFGLRCGYDAPADAFMAVELRAGTLDSISGLVSYHVAFDEAAGSGVTGR